jgi:uncharacterized protein (DUF433 family)
MTRFDDREPRYRSIIAMLYNKSMMNYQQIITIESGKRGGHPCIRGMRIAISDVLGWLATGMSHQEIIGDFPELPEDDIRACVAIARLRNHSIISPEAARMMLPETTI